MLIGEKVILEEIAPENIEQLRQWRNDPELRKFFREYRDISADLQKKWYEEMGNNSDPRNVFWQIVEYASADHQKRQDTDGRKLIGCCSLNHIDFRIGSAEFGIYLGKSRGGGKGKEAMLLMFSYGFSELNLNRLWAEVYSNNKALDVYRHIGFKDEGLLRHTQYCEGEYLDSHMISILGDEWREKYGNKPLWKNSSV